MTRRLTVLFSLVEAVLVAGIGIAIPLVPLTILWAAQYGFGPDWTIFGRAALDLWLVGHGVDLTLTLNPVLAGQLGQSSGQLAVTMAALGFATLTLVLGARAGVRIAETGHRVIGFATAAAAFAGLSAAATWGARLAPDVLPSRWQGVLLPTGVFVLGILFSIVTAEPDEHPTRPLQRLREWRDDLPPAVRAVSAAAFRSGAAAAAITVLFSALAVTVMVAVGYAQQIRLYESLHAGWAGSLAITAGQLAILPNLVIWAASWFVGPGFALGTGSAVSPLGTTVGPLPAIPVLGALPSGDLAFGFVGLVVPVIAGFVAGVATRRRFARDEEALGGGAVTAALGGGVVGGAVLGLLAWASAGSAGPGRFAHVGPDPLLVGCCAAAEFAVAILLGLLAGGSGLAVVERAGSVRLPRADRPPRRPESTEPSDPRRVADDVDTAPIPVVTGPDAHR